ncbi:MAG TPA: hypothetical protein VF652_12355 [Allosphingosinicella sp.]|jgi:hypothetical protein
MKDSREFLFSSAVGALKAVAGLFALSWMGIVLFPMTAMGLLALVLTLLALAIVYRRNLTVVKTIVALTISGLAIFTANIVSISRFDGPVYLFSCSVLDISCACAIKTEVYGRSVLIVPIWAPKAGFFRYALGKRERTYFPELVRSGERGMYHAPLEVQALQQADAPDPRGHSSFRLPVNLPFSALSLQPSKTKGEIELKLSAQSNLLYGIPLDSALSRSVPGQFSILTAETPGPEDWKRLAFSNETIRALMTDPAAGVAEELFREAGRTGLIEDFMRYATLKLALNEGFYPDLPGAGQRLSELRSAIRKADAYGDFRIAADLPWNRAFLIKSLDTLRDLRGYHTDLAPIQRKRLPDGAMLSIQASGGLWRQEWEWIADKGQSIWAGADPQNRFGNAMLGSFLDGSISRMDDFFTKWEQLDPPDSESLRAKEIFRHGASFEHFFAEWLAEVPGSRARRVAVMGGTIGQSTMRIAMGVLGGSLTELDTEKPAERIALLKKVQAARAQLRSNDARSGLVAGYAANEFQQIDLSRDSMTFDFLFELLERAIVCGPSEKDCERLAVEFARAYISRAGSPSLLLPLLIDSATEHDSSGRAMAAKLIRLMDKVAAPMTPQEFDQGIAPVALLMMDAGKFGAQRFRPQICAAADAYSRRLISEPGSDDRVFLHEGAMLLALACRRSWGDDHRLALARKGLDPGLWVTLIQKRAKRVNRERARSPTVAEVRPRIRPEGRR